MVSDCLHTSPFHWDQKPLEGKNGLISLWSISYSIATCLLPYFSEMNL